MLKATQLGGFGGGGDTFETFEVTFQGTDVTPNSTGTNNTFTGFALGAPSPSRQIYVFVHYVTDTNFTTALTVGGVSAVFIGGQLAGGPTPDLQMDVYVADVPTGTTGDIVVSFGSSYTSAIGVSVYRSVGATDQLKFFGVAAQDAGTTLSQSAGLVAPKNVVLLCASQDANANTFTWTNVDENADVDSGGTNPFRVGAASRTFTTHQGQTELSVSSIASGSTAQVALCVVISGNRDPEGNWLAAASNVANQSSYTFSNFALGPPNGFGRARRAAIVVTVDGSTQTLDSATIDGGTATIHATSATGVGPRVWIISRLADMAPVGSVVVNFSAAVNNCAISGFKINHLKDSAPFDAETNTTGSGTSLGVTIDVPNKGLLLGGFRHANANNAALSGITQRDQGDVETHDITVGFEDNRAAATGASVSNSWTTAAAAAIAVISWK